MSWITSQLSSRDITDPRVLAAMEAVPRHEFVPPEHHARAYEDAPVPIGFGHTISQPYIVAWMTQALGVAPGLKVLEVGTGCGYQTAILLELGAEVWSLDVIPELTGRARDTLARLGHANVHLRTSSGYAGWPEAQPFDRILVTAAPPDVPDALIAQLGDGGRLVAPVGTWDQVLVIVERHGSSITRREAIAVRFVPMV